MLCSGDWVHIRNPNDLAKPIVAQICRLWQDEAGKQWINACWYYRPEQTVHRVSKRFYKNEVMKTGQYRGHLVDDIVDRCFVMFHTRYHKGRPRGFPRDKEVYVCEARYNEDRYTFNRIKTWTSCLPDEVRERDYEMDLFDVPRRLRKEPTPIAHLLKEGARETDPLPKPNWGHKDAPPVIGGVHIRPREPNVSHVPCCFCLYCLFITTSPLGPCPYPYRHPGPCPCPALPRLASLESYQTDRQTERRTDSTCYTRTRQGQLEVLHTGEVQAHQPQSGSYRVRFA